jgi:hypothetical protein
MDKFFMYKFFLSFVYAMNFFCNWSCICFNFLTMRVEIIQFFYYIHFYLENWKEDVTFEWCIIYWDLVQNIIKLEKNHIKKFQNNHLHGPISKLEKIFQLKSDIKFQTFTSKCKCTLWNVILWPKRVQTHRFL